MAYKRDDVVNLIDAEVTMKIPEELKTDIFASTLLLAKFKDSYTLQMRNDLNKVEDALNYITVHIFDISLEDVKKILFIS
ncbi:MAG: hypothetical protein M1542_06935 [Thermotogae bacterium]|jgi:hypothetical protein|nr:hypothetical protein [Thermotogota bacterium]